MNSSVQPFFASYIQQVSISSTLNVQMFRMHVGFGSFFLVTCTLPKRRSSEKFVRLLLMKLTAVRIHFRFDTRPMINIENLRMNLYNQHIILFTFYFFNLAKWSKWMGNFVTFWKNNMKELATGMGRENILVSLGFEVKFFQ